MAETYDLILKGGTIWTPGGPADADIGERTVELYFSQLRGKLGVATRNEAVGKAIDERIIQRGELPDVLEAVRARPDRRRASATSGQARPGVTRSNRYAS